MNFQEILSPQEIDNYKSQGFSESDIQQAVNESEAEISQQENSLQSTYARAQQQKMQDPRARASNSFVAGALNENLIQWQLELDSILERVEHMLRGDKPTWLNGSIVWLPPKSDKEKVLNEFGVAEIMRVLSNYVNRNTILSNYREETINDKMYDLGMELADLFYLKYEIMGLDNLEKRKLYPILVRELVDICHSSYLRALHGGERESLREARQVNQTESTQGGVIVNTGAPQQSRGILNPLRYLAGKYK